MVEREGGSSKAKFFKNAQICVETFETARRAPLGESLEESAFAPCKRDMSAHREPHLVGSDNLERAVIPPFQLATRLQPELYNWLRH